MVVFVSHLTFTETEFLDFQPCYSQYLLFSFVFRLLGRYCVESVFSQAHLDKPCFFTYGFLKFGAI